MIQPQQALETQNVTTKNGWRRYTRVPGPVHPRDTMLFDDGEERLRQYVAAGLSAKEAVGKCLDSAGKSWSDVGRFLDFGCGFGRVLRHLLLEMAGAEIIVTDLEEEAVSFCHQAFDVEGKLSSTDLDTFDLGRFDLIWSGSVITHLSAEDGDAMMGFLRRSLEEDGIAVFSFHGQHALEFLPTHYGLEVAKAQDEIKGEVEESGFSFRTYRRHILGSSYGVSFHRHDTMVDKLKAQGLEVVAHLPAGWNHHHDVVAVRPGN